MKTDNFKKKKEKVMESEIFEKKRKIMKSENFEKH